MRGTKPKRTPRGARPIPDISVDQLLTKQEVAVLWRVSARTIEKHLFEGTFPVAPRQMGLGKKLLWSSADIRAWLSAQTAYVAPQRMVG